MVVHTNLNNINTITSTNQIKSTNAYFGSIEIIKIIKCVNTVENYVQLLRT